MKYGYMVALDLSKDKLILIESSVTATDNEVPKG